MLGVPLAGGEEPVANRNKALGQDRADRELADAGWETDGSFSEHLAIGESGDLCVLVHRSTWEAEEPAYELYDVARDVSYWVHEVPTPDQAAKLLEEHGEASDETEQGAI
jgi:hypothetical protein